MNLQVVFATEEQKADPMYQLEKLERRIRESDDRGLRARWEFGQNLIALRQANYDKTLEQIGEHLKVSRQELGYRMQFASSKEALANAVGRGLSWHETVKQMPELVGRARAPKRTGKVTPLISEFRGFIRRVKTELAKVHAKDLREIDFKVLDAIQEEIVRIYDEVNPNG